MKYMIAVFAVAAAVAATTSARPQDPIAPRKGHALAPVGNGTLPSGNETQQQQLRPAGRKHGGHPRLPVLNGTDDGDNSTNPQQPEAIRHRGHPRLPAVDGTNAGNNDTDSAVNPEPPVANTRVARRANPHHGGRRGPGGRGYGHTLNGTVYNYGLKDGNNSTANVANVSAIAFNDSSAIIFKRDNRPEGRGKDGSCGVVVYSYNNTDSRVLFAPKNPKESCIVFPGSGLTYEQLVNGVKEKNGTVVDAPTQRLDATGQNLTAEETQKLNESHPNAMKICGNRTIVVATAASGDGTPARNDTKQIVLYGLNIYNVTVNGTASTSNARVRIGGDGEGIRAGGSGGRDGPRGRPPRPRGRPGENDNRRRN